MTNTPDKERAYVRGLAEQVAAIAGSRKNQHIKRRWCDVNALRKPDRAPVLCRPVGAWAEILPEDALECADPWLRGFERGFRRALFKHELGDDTPLESYYAVGTAFDIEPANVWGVDVEHEGPGVNGGAWAYAPPLKTEADFDRLRLPQFSYNDAKTQEALSRTDDLLGDILPVKLVCDAPLGATMGTAAADFRGLNEMMMDMAAEPELMHRLMSHLRDGVLGAMDQVAATGLLTPNNIGPMICSDPVGDEPEDAVLTYRNLWVYANSQEFDAVSPEMWEEFCLNYQRPIMDQFGLACYGCCENLTHKIDGVLSIPNLRIFVCSAWTDLDKVIEKVGSDYVIMWRQKASDVVFPDDVGELKRGLEEGMKRLQGCHYQVVLRELQTLAGHPDRLHVWTQLAKEAAGKYG
jgi:hypothetical protein